MLGEGVALAAEAGGAAGPVSIDLWTFIFQSINIFIVLFVLARFLFKPVGEIIRRREEYVNESLESARRAREEAERLRQEYEGRVREAQREAQAIIEQATKAAEARSQAILAEAQAEAERTRAKALAEINAERERALAEIRDQVADLIVLAAGQVLGRAIEDRDHRRLAEEFAAKVGELR